MIDEALKILAESIDDYLHRTLGKIEDPSEMIKPTSILKHDGSVAIPEKTLGFSLVNVEEERVVKAQKTVAISSDGQISHINPELKLNLFILIASNHTDYLSGLAQLSGVIRFFQSKSVFNHQNTPGLDPGIQKLIAELFTLNFEEQNHLWGSIGAKYLPSVLYRIRLISIQEAQKIDEQPPIRAINASEKAY